MDFNIEMTHRRGRQDDDFYDGDIRYDEKVMVQPLDRTNQRKRYCFILVALFLIVSVVVVSQGGYIPEGTFGKSKGQSQEFATEQEYVIIENEDLVIRENSPDVIEILINEKDQQEDNNYNPIEIASSNGKDSDDSDDSESKDSSSETQEEYDDIPSEPFEEHDDTTTDDKNVIETTPQDDTITDNEAVIIDDTTESGNDDDTTLDENTITTNESSTSINEEDELLYNWLDSTVTLGDGPKFEIVEQIYHSKASFTEGLTYANGVLYESIGLNGQSSVLLLNATTGETLHSYNLERKYFGEGLTYMNGKLVQLTWKSKTGFIYDANDLSIPPINFTFETTTDEGWGITYDTENNELIVSDGSQFLHFWDPETMQQKRKIEVKRMNGKNANNMNELELWRGRVLANIWYEDTIIVIDPQTGSVEKEYDFSTLWPEQIRSQVRADVLNGISVSADPDILYVTGKNWDRMFRLKLN